MTHSPFSSALPLPITWPLLVTVTSLPAGARPAITREPRGSTRTTSKEGAAGCDSGLAAGGVTAEGGSAACCVAVGWLAPAGAVGAAALFETDAAGAVGAALVAAVADVVALLAGAAVDAVPDAVALVAGAVVDAVPDVAVLVAG